MPTLASTGAVQPRLLHLQTLCRPTIQNTTFGKLAISWQQRDKPFRQRHGRVGSFSAKRGGSSDDNPFVTNKGIQGDDECVGRSCNRLHSLVPSMLLKPFAICRNWSSQPDDTPAITTASSADLSMPGLGKQKLAKAPFPLLTKLLVSAMVLLFIYQVYPCHVCTSTATPYLIKFASIFAVLSCCASDCKTSQVYPCTLTLHCCMQWLVHAHPYQRSQ